MLKFMYVNVFVCSKIILVISFTFLDIDLKLFTSVVSSYPEV